MVPVWGEGLHALGLLALARDAPGVKIHHGDLPVTQCDNLLQHCIEESTENVENLNIY